MAKKAKRSKPDDPTTVPAQDRSSNAMPPEALADNKGSVSRVVDINVQVKQGTTKGVRISYDLLGVPVNPTVIEDVSGNRHLLDAKRPPVVESDDLMLFFDPELGAGNYAFQLKLTYEHDLEEVTPLPLVDDKYAGVEEKRSARRHR